MFATFNYFRPAGPEVRGGFCLESKVIDCTEIWGDNYRPDTDLDALRDHLIKPAVGNNPFAYRKDLPPGTRPEEWLEIRLWDFVEQIQTKIGVMYVLSLNHPLARGEADTEILFPTGEGRGFHGEIMQDHHCMRIDHQFRITFLEGRPEKFATAYGPRAVSVFARLPSRLAA